MPLALIVTPGQTFATDGTDKVTYAKLNQLGVPLITISGTVSTSEIEDGAVTTAKIAADAVTGAKIPDGAIGLEHLLTADQGSILHRGSSGWELLTPGTSGQVLTTKGASNDAVWATVPSVSSVSASNIGPGANNTVLITNASGNTTWATVIPISNITNGANNTKLVTNDSGTVAWETDVTKATYVAWDQKTSGTSGGTFTAGIDVTRTLTNESDPGGIASLATNQITLGAGTYYCEATVPANRVAQHVAWLYDTTGATTLLDGTSAYSDTAANSPTYSHIKGTFTLSGNSDLEVRHRCHTTRSGDGLGFSHGITGHNNIYTQIAITRLS